MLIPAPSQGLDCDSIDATLRSGSDEQVNHVIKEWLQSTRADDAYILESFAISGSPLGALRDEIHARVRLYCSHTGFVAKRASPSILDMNATVALMGQYDLVVGVAQGGIPLPILMEMMGQPTAYVLSSREHNKSHWFTPIRNKPRPAQANRVLVCEDDAETGWTLNGVLSNVAVLRPTQVDLCFTKGLSFAPSKAAVGGMGFSRVFSTLEVPFDDFMAHVRSVAEAAKKATLNKQPTRMFPDSSLKRF